MSNLKVGDLRIEFFNNEILIHKIVEFESPSISHDYVHTVYYYNTNGRLFHDVNELSHFIKVTKPLNKFFNRLYNVKEMFND